MRGPRLCCGVASSVAVEAKRRAHPEKRHAVAVGKNIDVYNSIGHHGNSGGLGRRASGGRMRWMWCGMVRGVAVAVDGSTAAARCWCRRQRWTLLWVCGAGWETSTGGAANLSDSVILVNSFSSRIVTNSAHGGRAKLARSHATALVFCFFIFFLFLLFKYYIFFFCACNRYTR